MSKDKAKRKAYALRTIALGRDLVRIGEEALQALEAPKSPSPPRQRPFRRVPISTGP